MDFMFATVTAVPAQIGFICQLLLSHPKELCRMQSEIDRVVGSGRLPELDDRSNLPFTEACIREALRIETVAPSSIPHRTLRDTKLAGYDIPADCYVFPNLVAMHEEKKVWGDDSLQFRPDRLLDARQELSLKLDKSLPFGAGKRLCAGETFARNSIFLFVAAFFQNFNIRLPDGVQLDTSKNASGFIRYPPNFWVAIQPR